VLKKRTDAPDIGRR